MAEAVMTAPKAIVLSAEVFAEYESQAKAAGVSVEQFIEKRLMRCKRHNAERGLYFNDNQRRDLEKALGGSLFLDASAVIATVNRQYTFKIEGLTERIVIDGDLMQAIKTRAEEMHTPIKDFMHEAVMTGIRQKVGWE